MMTGLSYKKTIDNFGVSDTPTVHWMKCLCWSANWTIGFHENPNDNPENFFSGLWMLLHSNTMC